MGKPPKPSFRDAMFILSNGISALSDAYRSANTIEDKDRVFSVMSVLQDESSAIVSAGRANDTDAFKAQSQFFAGAKATIDQFQQDIGKIIRYLQVAGAVADTLLKVATLL